MKKRDSINNKKVVVYKATSLENEIRFYVDKGHYIVTEDKGNGKYVVKKEKDGDDTYQKQEKAKIMKKIKTKAFPLVYWVTIYSFIMFTMLPIFMISENIIISFALAELIVTVTIFMIKIKVEIMLMPTELKMDSIKSKHSAEHMMVKFISKYQRLPNSEEELRKLSRFDPWCGNRKIADEAVSELIIKVFAIICSSLILIFNAKEGCIMLIIIGLLIPINIEKVEWGKLDTIIDYFRIPFGYIFQLKTTSKEVKSNDINMAYLSAKYWMLEVCPELYDESKESEFVFENVNNEKD